MSITISTYKRCKRCKEYFFKSSTQQIYCHQCQGKEYLTARLRKCMYEGCKHKVGESGRRGYCNKHYRQIFKSKKTWEN